MKQVDRPIYVSKENGNPNPDKPVSKFLYTVDAEVKEYGENVKALCIQASNINARNKAQTRANDFFRTKAGLKATKAGKVAIDLSKIQVI